MQSQTDLHLADNALVKKILAGDTEAFGLIVRQTERLVIQIVYKMATELEERKDIIQEVYGNAFRHLSGFRNEARLSTWIGRIAYNTCLAHLKKAKKVPFVHGTDETIDPAGSSAADEQLLQKERTVLLTSAIDRLPPVYRTMIILFHQEEMDYREIGVITGLPAGTVKSYLFRARQRLKQFLSKQYENGDL